MDTETLEYVIHPMYISRILQLLPVYYKINRVNGLNTYQSSVLFTIYNEDPHGDGMRKREVVMHNPMATDAIGRNLGELVEKGLLFVTGQDKPRSTRYSVTIAGVQVVQAIMLKAMSYKGEKINTLPQEGTYVDRMKKNKEKSIQRMVDGKVNSVKEAYRRIIEKEQLLKDKEENNE